MSQQLPVLRALAPLAALLAVCGGSVAAAPQPVAAPAAVVASPKQQPARVDLAGNAFITQAGPDAPEWISYNEGLKDWSDPATVISTYVRVAQPGRFNIALKGVVPPGGISTVKVSALGRSFTLRLTPTASVASGLAVIDVPAAGYVKIDVQGLTRSGPEFAQLQAIELSGTAASGLQYANQAADSGYYWSRRGPSVHMSYTAPADVEYFYNELTIPAGEDKVGSFFMANGFGEGYMGIQVKERERWVLFSVWDPSVGKTTLVRKGPEVVTNEFGGEGTGGQSRLTYAWRAGTTYPFITRVRPDGQGGSLYSAWFYAVEEQRWRFIATWLRPNTQTWLVRPHSFLENFIDTEGHQGRKLLMGRQWAVDKQGVWTELNRGRFTVDATGAARQRLDFAGGLDASGRFYLRNGGFFNETVPANQNFTRPLTGQQPAVDLSTLP
ncbi:DUF5077 domain-containing protein [Roseateles sp. DAIF2]|uniref:DUF3472 domain-containing protein n=1 Tax=Roseateles sp. DAIF2 TaxID=2714952 RepID=UPI0018A26C04|nr:DUF3472 domain-containing protein [Roseateles sp. DAIF2]QPF71487.1 DUF5077 domain-containing protein [Roseateles sp. DAIF2]